MLESNELLSKDDGMCSSDDGLSAVLTPRWAGLLCHIRKRHGCQLALLLATIAAMALFQHLHVTLKDTTAIRVYPDRKTAC